MLRNPAVFDSKKIVVGRRRFGACLYYSKNEIALRDVAAGYQHRGSPGLFHLGDSRFHPCGPITDVGGMLNVVITVDEFVDAIKAQFDSHHLLNSRT